MDAAAREALAAGDGVGAGPRAHRTAGRRSVGDAWLEALQGDPVVRAKDDQLAAFAGQYRAWADAAGVLSASGEPFRLCLRLHPPPAVENGEGVLVPRPTARDWALEYSLQATDDPSLLVPAADVWRQRGSTARFLSRRLEQPQEHLLAWLGQASRLFPPIDASLRTATAGGRAADGRRGPRVRAREGAAPARQRGWRARARAGEPAGDPRPAGAAAARRRARPPRRRPSARRRWWTSTGRSRWATSGSRSRSSRRSRGSRSRWSRSGANGSSCGRSRFSRRSATSRRRRAAARWRSATRSAWPSPRTARRGCRWSR